MNSRAPEIAINLRTYLPVSFYRSGVNSLRARSALVLHEQTRIAATRLVWKAVILNITATLVDQFQTVGDLKGTDLGLAAATHSHVYNV